ncbi:response regulator transcription factor [Paenibacillus aurantius]|uniref:Response regulator transcription factor n=1 Tax=Paenibacillus aurantius TaxID=2918900 RepID=A0AA96LFU7_9BACL|nr:response regulator transcription factor [Paenibacillus aurantius]WNQ13132.1 response regulator transcription factor [Paenibacillus aurantius]
MHILVIEDEPKIRDMLVLYFENEGWTADCTPNGHEACQMFRQASYDLVILDLMLEGLQGEDVCRTIRQQSQVPLIMLTSRARESDTIKGLNLGADDYIIKPFRAKELVARIYALMRRVAPAVKEARGNGRIFQRGKMVIFPEEKQVLVEGRSVSLTATEYKLLEILSARPGRIFHREELIYMIHGDRFEGDGRTMDAHIKNLRKKIEPGPGHPTYIVTVIGLGYKFGVKADGET